MTGNSTTISPLTKHPIFGYIVHRLAKTIRWAREMVGERERHFFPYLSLASVHISSHNKLIELQPAKRSEEKI